MPDKTDPARDCPPCPKCRLHTGILAENMGNGIDGGPECTLGCCACGHGWVGTPAEVERARLADEAYANEQAAEEGRPLPFPADAPRPHTPDPNQMELFA